MAQHYAFTCATAYYYAILLLRIFSKEMNQEDSPEFRLHVRNLLHDYCLQHCTTNYVAFTEDLVAEVNAKFQLPTHCCSLTLHQVH